MSSAKFMHEMFSYCNFYIDVLIMKTPWRLQGINALNNNYSIIQLIYKGLERIMYIQ